MSSITFSMLSRDEAYNLLTFLQEYLMLFDQRMSEVFLPCRFIYEIASIIEELYAMQLCTLVVEE